MPSPSSRSSRRRPCSSIAAEAHACGAGLPSFPTKLQGSRWPGWGPTVANTRYQDASAAGLPAADVPRLKLKWAFGLGEIKDARGQPTVVGGRVFDAQGALLWEARVAKGGKLGGMQWGSAADAENLYAAVSDVAVRPYADASSPLGFSMDVAPDVGGGLVALRLGTGKEAWRAKPAGACGVRKHCSPAQSAAVTVVPGVVFFGAMDGHLRAYDTATGKVIWEVDTMREYETVNGLGARGGSLDVGGVAVVGGMLFLSSGYALWGGTAGNVLLAFSVDGK